MTDESKPSAFSFSREIRLGDLLTIGTIILAGVAWTQHVDLRLQIIETAQASQVETNKELRSNVREVANTMAIEIKEQGATVRRIEDKINRARL